MAFVSHPRRTAAFALWMATAFAVGVAGRGAAERSRRAPAPAESAPDPSGVTAGGEGEMHLVAAAPRTGGAPPATRPSTLRIARSPADLPPLRRPTAVRPLRTPCRPPRRASVHVRSLEDGAVLVASRDRMLVNPASNLKIVTAAAAVELLGPDARLATELWADGTTLYVRGEGDPALLARHLFELLDRASIEVPLSAVDRVVADASAFADDGTPAGYPDADSGDAYLAPVSALSLQFNTVELVPHPGGLAARPVSTAVRIDDRSHVGDGEPRIFVGEDPVGTRILVTGSRRPTARLRARIVDAPRFVAGAIAHMIAQRTGGPPPRVEIGTVPVEARRVATHLSPPLASLAAASLKYSNNFTAEQILRVLGRAHTGQPGTTASGAAAVVQWWRAIGGNPRELVLENGSGLSHATRITTRAIADVLARIADPASPSHALLPSLAVAGWDGTLRHRMPHLEGRIRGKTGTLAGVSALSGIAAGPSGRRAAFSIVQNGVDDIDRARREQDAYVQCLVTHLSAPDGRDAW
ncbi:MAG: D-alanyl-D-alanine carboxypeptidase/D-alanyl-D-alanine-endopeptidase [Deltaproteobacteria bacterium]|nr:MAG: D-alanyl-D-alanine carboxypeptidase/D-alanyl-D-alanine-endopeptidase [Deltaproteobacteria bacterium]